ncbi:ABC transporter ATP-binding protein [Paenibacillus sp. FSL H7-0350]|uniref:ABC transporter ATP-binding protein n=1 Tax=Paenibacillus sp. FSL H7-0350 TaxID=2975345 RepID=UPI0031590137
MFVDIQNITKEYESGNVLFKALNNVSLTLEQGRIAVILGPSGSGKSTLLNILGGMDLVNQGTVEIDGRDITKCNDSQLTEYRRECVGFVFQFYNLIPNLTVYENVEVSANISKQPLSIDEMLKAVGMNEMKHRFPRELSGGQQQRVSIARALVKNPKLLLCDEPTGALDYKTSKDILKIIEEINEQFNTTILLITHNQAIAHMAHRIIRIRSGEIIEDVINENRLPAERIEW